MACLAIALLPVTDASAQAFTSGGKLTYYGGGSGGACSLGTIPSATVPFDFYAAVGADVWDASGGCGRFVEIDTTNGCGGGGACTSDVHLLRNTITVMIADECPECVNGHFDLSPAAFASVVDPGTSSIVGQIENIDWRIIHGQHPGPIRINSATGTSPWWYSFTVFDHNDGIAQAEVKSSGSSTWIEFDRTSANRFQIPASAPIPLVAPLSIRLMGSNAEVLLLTDVVTNFNGETFFTSSSQFTPPAQPPVPMTGPLGGAIIASLLAGAGLWQRSRRQRPLEMREN